MYLWYVAQWFTCYEGLYHLYKKGHITPETWRPKVDFMVVMLKQPLVEAWWARRMAPFSSDYFDYIEERRLTSEVPVEHKDVIRTLGNVSGAEEGNR